MSLSKFSLAFKENECSDFIPYAVHITDTIIKTHGADYIQTIKVSGISHESADLEDLIIWKDQLNILLKNIAAPNVSLWTNIIRREINNYPNGKYDKDTFAYHLNEKYKAKISKNSMMVNELFITIIYRQGITKVEGFFRKHSEASMDNAIEKLNEISSIVCSALQIYQPRVLGIYQIDGHTYSEVKEFLSYLINGEWQQRRLSNYILSDVLAFNRPFFGSEAFEIRGLTNTTYGAILGIIQYPSFTEAGLINAFLTAPFPLIITQSFNFLSKPVGTALLERQQRRMENANDHSLKQIKELTQALDDLTSGDIVFGEHHINITVFANSPKQLKENIASARSELANCDIIVAREDWALEAAFWAQLPANHKYRPRPAPITSKNFAGFCSLHNYPIGRITGNQWGAAVTMFKTSSGSPYFFNFHEPLDPFKAKKQAELEAEVGLENMVENLDEQKAVGHTMIYGKSGTGKTVVQAFLMSQVKKFKPTQVVFDKDQGLEIFVRASGGIYLPLKNGQPTGFNPFCLDPREPFTQTFLEGLIKKCASGNFTAKQEYDITNAVRGVLQLPSDMRRMSMLIQFLDPTEENGVYARLQKWCGDGSLAWVFDNPVDRLSFNGDMFGFDVTDFLDNPEIRTPLIMYLFHRVEKLIDGRRILIFMDEFWKLLEDAYFEDLIKNKLKVFRKQNGILVFGTQSPADIINSPIRSTLVEQVSTIICLGNERGKLDDYVTGLSMSEREFQIIKEDLPGTRRFLIKQGQQSIIADLDLQGFSNELNVLSGNATTVGVVNNIIEEIGTDDPKIWLPIFYSKLNSRKEQQL